MSDPLDDLPAESRRELVAEIRAVLGIDVAGAEDLIRSAEPLWEAEYAGTDFCFNRRALSEDICFHGVGDAKRRAGAGDCGAGSAFGGAVCVDCVSEDEYAARADGGLASILRPETRREPLLLRWLCR